MKTYKTKMLAFWMIVSVSCLFHSVVANDVSIYPLKPNDADAVYFTPENFNIKADGTVDVSEALQEAINKAKSNYNFGIVFIPEGSYKISRTIYIPKAIRLIGYGSKRPVIFLAKNSPGFQQEVVSDKGKANYMFWFTDRMVEKDQEPRDAGAGTFYSALSNVNLRIEDGNPYAVALRTHFAQHSFIENVNIYIGKGKAGLFDVGNEMENVGFYGGDYGIYTTKTSPGWQMMMVDTYFEGQRKAAIKSQESGLTIVRLQAKNVPTVIESDDNFWDKIFMENCQFDNISGPAFIISNENNFNTSISLRNIDCRKVPVFAEYRTSKTKTVGNGNLYTVKNFIYGAQLDNLNADPEFKTTVDIQPLKAFPAMVSSDIPQLPDMNSWINIRELGAKGDGATDDTKVFQDAIEKYTTIYIPQGWYVVSQTLKLKPSTCLIGLNPISTEIMLLESTPAFSGFGGPVPVIETPMGGTNIVTGIGINTGGYNYRAVGCKWMSGAESYLNDVKFIGGHGTMARGPVAARQEWRREPPKISSPSEPVVNQGMDKAWDNQYWSLWVTNGGGGTIKNIWTANTYSANGVYVSNTSTQGRIYAMSIEHHVRNEAHFKNVSNWKVYAFQTEEESRESSWCQPIEVDGCSNMVFANLYMFRVIRLVTPYPYSLRTWNCRNIEFLNVHNYTQIKYTTTLPIYDINTDLEVRPWEFARLNITGNEVRNTPLTNEIGKVEKLATGFEFAEGIARDSKGNIYFCEQHMRRIYKWDADKNSLSLLANFPWEPLSLAVDTKDNLLVVFKYNPQPGYKINGAQETVPTLPDADGTSFSGWGNSGFATWVYSINPANPEETIALLPSVPMGSVKNVAKALYPSNRWRDAHDFNQVSVAVPANCFVAPDGVTIIPECYDLARSSSVLEAIPGQPFYATDEYNKRTVAMDVDTNGKLSNLRYFVEMGEFSSAVDCKGNIYIADGQIYVYDKTGKKINTLYVPERPTTIQFGGKDGNTLFIATRSSLFGLKVE